MMTEYISNALIWVSTASLLVSTSIDLRLLLLATLFLITCSVLHFYPVILRREVVHDPKVMASALKRKTLEKENEKESEDFSVVECIQQRHSVFPNHWKRDSSSAPVDPRIVQSLLDAALLGPFHGKCHKGNDHPARFVILGKKGQIEMQNMTLEYYDKEWKNHWETEEDYQKWRDVTEEEITGRWGPCDYMIAIVMRRQSGPKRFPEWEEAAATAAAVQNMHIQSTKFPQLACYWSSWHDAARDSVEMKQFLNMEKEDRCLGFFMVAQKKSHVKNRRIRKRELMSVEWRS